MQAPRALARAIGVFRAWPSPVRRLFAARFLRSLTQGCLVVDFALYLRLLNWTGAEIGTLLGSSFAVGAALSLVIGPASDRLGCKRLLVGYECATALAFFAAAATRAPWVISAGAVFAGFGRGANGAPGSFVPAELSWLAGFIPEQRRGAAYSLNTATGFIGMGLGAALAIGPSLWAHALPGACGYRPLFVFGGVVSVGIAMLLAATPEQRTGKRPAPSRRTGPQPPGALRPQERRRLWQISLISLFSGISLGLSGPLIAYWYAVKFHLDPLHIAPVLAAAQFAAALFAFATGWLAQKFGSARSFVLLQAIGAVLLLGFPFVPSFRFAAVIWVLRFAIERGATGAMEAVVMGLVGAGRRGLAGGLNTASLALPRALGPLAAGHWIAEGDLAAPFLLAALLQAIYVALFGIVFARPAREVSKL